MIPIVKYGAVIAFFGTLHSASTALAGSYLDPVFYTLGIGIVGSAAAFMLLSRRVSVQHSFVRKLEIALERERIDLASDIHDGPLQDLYATRFLNDHSDEQLEDLLAKVRGELRAITMRLESPSLDRGLIRELKTLTDCHARLPLRLIAFGDDKALSDETAHALLRIARTAIANVYRHSEASEAEIVILIKGSEVTMIIRDNGKGFDLASIASTPSEHFGLYLMRHYAEAINAKLEIVSNPESGTLIHVQCNAVSSVSPRIHSLKLMRIWKDRSRL